MSRIALAAVLGASTVASADFVNASFTQESLEAGEVTYRIFLNYDSPLDKQLARSCKPEVGLKSQRVGLSTWGATVSLTGSGLP